MMTALRLMDVVKMYPGVGTGRNHPYSNKFIYADRQSGEAYYANAFDQAG